jgi:hypothetical protein
MKRGKIITQPILRIEPGLHVYWNDKVWVVQDENKSGVVLGENVDDNQPQTADHFQELGNLVLVDDTTGFHFQLGFIDWAKAIHHKLVNTDKSVPYMIHPLGWYRREATIDWVGYPEMKIEPVEGEFSFSEEDMLRAFEAGEYKMEYPKTAPTFDWFIQTVKHIKRASREISQ